MNIKNIVSLIVPFSLKEKFSLPANLKNGTLKLNKIQLELFP